MLQLTRKTTTENRCTITIYEITINNAHFTVLIHFYAEAAKITHIDSLKLTTSVRTLQ